MATEGISQALMQSMLSAQKASAGGGGDEGQMDFADFLGKALGAKISLLAKLTGGAAPDVGQAGQVSLTQPIDAQGIAGSNIPNLLSQVDSSGGVLYRAFKMLISNRDIINMAEGVGGDIHATVASLGESMFQSIPWESLGSISSQTFASAAPSIDMGMSV